MPGYQHQAQLGKPRPKTTVNPQNDLLFGSKRAPGDQHRLSLLNPQGLCQPLHVRRPLRRRIIFHRSRHRHLFLAHPHGTKPFRMLLRLHTDVRDPLVQEHPAEIPHHHLLTPRPRRDPVIHHHHGHARTLGPSQKVRPQVRFHQHHRVRTDRPHRPLHRKTEVHGIIENLPTRIVFLRDLLPRACGGRNHDVPIRMTLAERLHQGPCRQHLPHRHPIHPQTAPIPLAGRHPPQPGSQPLAVLPGPQHLVQKPRTPQDHHEQIPDVKQYAQPSSSPGPVFQLLRL